MKALWRGGLAVDGSLPGTREGISKPHKHMERRGQPEKPGGCLASVKPKSKHKNEKREDNPEEEQGLQKFSWEHEDPGFWE